MKFLSSSILLELLFLSFAAVGQRGKDAASPLSNITALNTVVNTYTFLTANANAGTSVISLSNASMTGGAFSSALAPGDLILIIQMQGATMDIDVTVSTDPSWGPSNYTTPFEHTWDGTWPLFAYKWGRILNYNNAGKFEQAEVRSVSGNNVTLQCPLQNSYTASGRVQVVRVPRFQNLTINTGASIVPQQWNVATQTGGVVAVEVNGNLTLNANSRISATGLGFRGGTITGQVGETGTNTASTNGAGNGDTFLGSSSALKGARKGEGIGGSNADYVSLYSEFGRGAAANGGGGGGTQNAGGGGGANVFVGAGTYSGKGVPNTTYNTAWNLELAGFGGSSSPGGGRGGYAYSALEQNANAIGPNNTAWGGNARKINGGLGGHPLAYDATRLFMGGGGGAGEQDSGEAGAGGNGGGIVFITCYGSVTGTGIIESDGTVGQTTNPLNQSPSTGDQRKGNDGAGGGGAGGSIYIKNASALPAGVTITARGGNGGNVNLSFLNPLATQEGNGPGGGGSGGNIAFTSGTPTQIVTGGNAGTTNSNQLTEMVVNGATNGAVGASGLSTSIFNITPNNISVCQGAPVTLSVSTTGVLPGVLTWYTTQFGTTSVATGATYTPSPAPTATTTYYVGVCPGTFRVPVTVTITPSTAATFNPFTPICSGATLTLPSTSLQGFTGSWSPAPNNTVSATYTFTPAAGQCALPGTLSVTVNPNSPSTFNQVAPICAGGSFTLPSLSNEGFTGNWSPPVNNSVTTDYTFTPTAGQCASSATMTVAVNPNVTPTFNQVSPICNGGSFTLPASSNEAVTGPWSPAINNTSTTLYTFNPAAGQCATTANMTVTVNQPIDPTFNQIAPICTGGSFTLPPSSNEAITGTWSPGINNTSTTLYTFTPNVGQCANTATMTVSVGAPVAPTFNAIAPICSGSSLTLPLTSNEGFTGAWSPAINNTASTTYTFNPSSGQCATTATLTVDVNAPIDPVFTQLAPVCSGGSISLPGTSNNAINGSWSPVVNNTATTTYTFTPLAGECANTAAMTVTVNAPTTATFNSFPAICNGDPINLPATSNEGFTGSWSPAVNNTATTIYTFSPDPGQCASNGSLTVNVNQEVLPTFDQVPPVCAGTDFALPTISTNGITGTWSPAINTSVTTNYTFSPNPGQCATTATMTVQVDSPVTPTFNQWGPYCQNAILIQIILPETSNEGITGSWDPPMVSTAVAGNIVHTFTPDPDQCANGTTMTIVINQEVTPTFDQIAPICVGALLTLPTSSLEGVDGTWTPAPNNAATTTYTFTPSPSTCGLQASMTVSVGPPQIPTFDQIAPICNGGSISLPATSLEGFTGAWSPAPNNASTTTYTFTPTAGQCAVNGQLTVTVNQPVTPTFTAVGPLCSGDVLTLPAVSLEGVTGTWSPAINNTSTTNYTFTPDAGQCAQNGAMNVVVNQNPTVDISAVLISPEHCDQQDGAIENATVSGGTLPYAFEWNADQALNSLDISGLSAGSYTLFATDQNGCQDSATVTVQALAGPEIVDAALDVIQPTCVNGGSITGLTINGQSPFTYVWTDTTLTTLDMEGLYPGSYALTVTDNFGCETTYGPIVLNEPSGPQAGFTWEPLSPDVNVSVQFSNTSTGTEPMTYTWTVDGQTFTTESITYGFSEEGEFPVTLFVTDANGCISSITQLITVYGTINVPNVITANADGVNDFFIVEGLKPNTALTVVNRWGNVVYETPNYTNDWDGTDLTGQKLLEGVYTYVLTPENDKPKHGFIHLIR
ncbi:MAG: gliding motility-associated C-terminal domain-containing protein [Bacteroidota bacterium]